METPDDHGYLTKDAKYSPSSAPKLIAEGLDTFESYTLFWKAY